MTKRIISMLLLLAMLSMNACGDTSSEQKDDTTSSGGTDTTTAVETEASEYVKPDVDYDGKKFTIASYDIESAYTIVKYAVISEEEENGDIINDAIVQMTRKVEEELNVDLQMFKLEGSDRNTIDKLSKMIYAGDDTVQVAFPMMAALTKFLGAPTLLMDLKEIETLDLSRSWWNQNSIEEYTIGGKTYTATGDACFYVKGAGVVNYFNKQLIEDLKLGNPYQLVDEGKWTIDKQIEMATAAANDLNGNQKIDVEDRFGMICEVATLRSMLIGCGVDFSKRSGDDVEITFYTEKTASAVEKLIPFLRDKSVSMTAVEYQSGYKSVYTELFEPSFRANRGLFYNNQLLVALDFRAMEADFGVLPLAKYDEKQEEYYSFANTWWHDNLIVPATNQQTEMTGHVLNAMGYYAQQLITPAFIDTTVLGKSIRDDDSARMIVIVLDGQIYDIALAFDWGGINSMLSNLFTSESTNVASSYSSIEPSIKAAMEKTMDELLG